MEGNKTKYEELKFNQYKNNKKNIKKNSNSNSIIYNEKYIYNRERKKKDIIIINKIDK